MSTLDGGSWHIGTASRDGKSFLVMDESGQWKPAGLACRESFDTREMANVRAERIFDGWDEKDRADWDIVVFPRRMLEAFVERFPCREEKKAVPDKS